MNPIVVAALRVLLVLIFAGTVITQVAIIPPIASASAGNYPELAYLAVPYAVLWIAVVIAVQVALASLWILLGKARRGAIFTGSAFAWVNGIIVASLAATLLVAGFVVHLISLGEPGRSPIVFPLAGIVVAGVAFTLVMVVMRGLLRQATQLQTELEEVV